MERFSNARHLCPVLQHSTVTARYNEATRVASQYNLYAYDAYMLIAARRHQAPLLTLDGGLEEAARKSGIDILEV